GGGLARTSTTAGTVTVANSVVSGNSNANGPDILSSSTTTTNVNFSAIGSNTGFTLSGTSGDNLPFGANLLLGPLANNGGPTQTMAPQPGSPLINAGSNASPPANLTPDQRGPGFARIQGGTVDIGAYEDQPPTVAVPGDQTAFEDVDQALSGISVGDVDGDSLTVTLAVGHGTLALGTTTGLSVTGNGSGAVTLSGSVADLNAALATLIYRGSLN